MIQILKRAQNSNSVYSLGNKIILKKYLSTDRLNREWDAIKIWESALKDTVPTSYFKMFNYAGYKKIKNNSVLNNQQVLNKLVDIYIKNINNFKYHTLKKDKYYLSWGRYLLSKFREFEQTKYLIEQLNTKDRELTKIIFEEIREIDWTCYEKVPLHRDLCWDNIMQSDRNISIIDFEHFCIGPIEYEFCNSIFWNDKYSLNFERIVDLFRFQGIEINKTLVYKLTIVYFIEQLSLAKQDSTKLTQLYSQFKKFKRKYLKQLKTRYSDINLLKELKQDFASDLLITFINI